MKSLNEIDYQFWNEYWNKWPQQVSDANGRNLRPPEYRYKDAVVEFHKILKFKKTDKVLDVGCGTGETMKMLLPFVNSITGIEGAEHMFAHAIENLKGLNNVEVKLMNAVDIALPKESFDKVISVAVIQYIHRDFFSKYIQDMLFVTKAKGKIFIGDVIPDNPQKFDTANVSQIPEGYWEETWSELKPKIYKSGYEDRYHVVLTR